MTTRTISLFDRRPVVIDEDEWPEVASAVAYDDERQPTQANRTWTLKVREERRREGSGDAPRYLVYGVYRSAWQDERERRGGYLVDEQDGSKADAAVVRAVWDTVERLGFDTRLGDEVIQGLPAEEL